MQKEQSGEEEKKYVPREGQQNDERFIAVVDEVTRMKNECVAPTLKWFKDNAGWPGRFFLVSGALIIAMSVSVPLLGVVEGVWKDTLLPIFTLSIAALTGFNSFFQWQQQWRGRRQAQFAIEYLLSKWELEVVKAKHQSDPQEAIEIALKATERLLDQAREAAAAETVEYFRGIQLPRSK